MKLFKEALTFTLKDMLTKMAMILILFILGSHELNIIDETKTTVFYMMNIKLGKISN